MGRMMGFSIVPPTSRMNTGDSEGTASATPDAVRQQFDYLIANRTLIGFLPFRLMVATIFVPAAT